jgi:hypothetical protein
MKRVTEHADRRLVLAGAACMAVAPRAFAQGAAQPRRWLTSGQPGGAETYERAFMQRLNELGFVEGRNLVIERRGARGVAAALPELAADLARSGCDLSSPAASSPTSLR